MAKNQINLWRLIFVSLWLLAAAAAEAKTLLPLTGKDQYLAFSSLKGVFPRVSLTLDGITGVGILSSGGDEIRFKTGSSFYTHKLKIEKISLPVLYKKREIYLPPDLVEAVFLNLIGEEVSYQFTEKYLELEKGKIIPPATKLKYVIIDPGHGGKDPGTSDRNNNYEKDIALKLARTLEKMLQKEFAGVQTVLTRDDDVFISLEKRAEIANRILEKNQDSVYISLHCNATLNPEVDGYEIYFFSQTASTEKARELALIENQLLESRYSDPVKKIQADMLSSLIQRRSKSLAEEIDEKMDKNMAKYIQKRGVRKADFAVLRGSLMPAVLIEIGYLSNEKNSLYLLNGRVHKIISKSIIQGIREYAAKIKF